MDELTEKKKMIKEITRDLEEIKYIRDNYVFEDELSFVDVKELSLLTSNLWLKYHKLYNVVSSKL